MKYDNHPLVTVLNFSPEDLERDDEYQVKKARYDLRQDELSKELRRIKRLRESPVSVIFKKRKDLQGVKSADEIYRVLDLEIRDVERQIHEMKISLVE